ncbi:hypothetical protein B0H14DRAFT_1451435 [Mycena olivaceomarginata]|nr:hypothetical protein B0H14DRAFT_1451435 [Mycena olivaceomarginata]
MMHTTPALFHLIELPTSLCLPGARRADPPQVRHRSRRLPRRTPHNHKPTVNIPVLPLHFDAVLPWNSRVTPIAMLHALRQRGVAALEAEKCRAPGRWTVLGFGFE